MILRLYRGLRKEHPKDTKFRPLVPVVSGHCSEKPGYRKAGNYDISY